MSPGRRVAIRAGWIVAFDGDGHRLLRDGVVVVEGERIVHVGRTFDGTVDETVDARDRVLTPGLITTHAHIGGSPLDRSFIEDRGSPQFWYSGLFEMLPVRGGAQDDEAGRACVDFSMAELLRGGVTTCMEIGGLGEYVVERAAHYGLRVYMGLTFRSGRWLTRDGRRVVWEWDEEAGRRGLRRAVDFFEKHDGAHGGLVRCYFSPAQVDTCTPELLQEAKRRADEAGRPYTVHTSQSVVEFNEMLQRHGKTPIAWLNDLGVLGDNTVLGHAIIVGGSSWTNYPAGDVADHGRVGLLGGARGVGVRPPWRAHGVVRALPHGRHQHGAGHRHQSPVGDRGHAMGGGVLEGGRAEHRGDDRRPCLRRGDAGRRPGARPRRPRPHRARGHGRPGAVEGRLVDDDAAARPDQEHRLQRDRRGRRPRLRRRSPGGRRRDASSPPTRRKILADLQAGGERMWPRMKQFDWAGRSADELSPLSYRDWE